MLFKLIRQLRMKKMCKCIAPVYEVQNKILCCAICHKPTKWDASPSERK